MNTQTFFLHLVSQDTFWHFLQDLQTYATKNSRRSVVKYFPANLHLLVIKFWLDMLFWFTTAYATVS